MKKRCLMVLSLWAGICSAVSIQQGEQTFPTARFSDPNPVPQPEANYYPYVHYSGYTLQNTPQKWQTITLENDVLRATVFPELGGKIGSAIDKRTGVDFLFDNPALQFREIAVCGPWAAGGVEFNFGLIGHAPYSVLRVQTHVQTNADQSVSCFVGGLEWACETYWQVEIRLREACTFETHTFWFNASPTAQPYGHWKTAAFRAGPETEFFMQGSCRIDDEGTVAPWPVEEGHDLRFYSQHTLARPAHDHGLMYLLEGDTSFFGLWWPSVQAGALHTSLRGEMVGRKIWIWALSRQGALAQELLTPRTCGYLEVHTGRTFQQAHGKAWQSPFKYRTFYPGCSQAFVETWSSVTNRSELAQRMTPIKGARRPMESPRDFDWSSAYGLYIKGEQKLASGESRSLEEAENALCASRQKEPYFVPTLTLLGRLYVKEGRWADAKKCLQDALRLDTYAGEANYLMGLLATEEQDDLAAIDFFMVASQDPAFRSTAYEACACAWMRQKAWDEASQALQQALLANPQNVKAQALEIALLRHLGKTHCAKEKLRTARAQFPLYPAFQAEAVALHEADTCGFETVHTPERVCVDLAHQAHLCGFQDDEVFWLKRAGKSFVARVQAAFWAHQQGREDEAQQALQEAVKEGIGFDFPYSTASLSAFRWAAQTHTHWLFKYGCALLEAHFRQRPEACAHLRACAQAMDEPSALLFRAAYLNDATSLADIQRAQKRGDSFRVGLAFYAYYSARNQWDEACVLLADYVKRYNQSFELKYDYGYALMKAGRDAQAVAFLDTVKGIPLKTGERPTKAYQVACGHLAEKALAQGDEVQAHQWLEKALDTPEGLGQGRSFRDDRVIQLWSERVQQFWKKISSKKKKDEIR